MELRRGKTPPEPHEAGHQRPVPRHPGDRLRTKPPHPLAVHFVLVEPKVPENIGAAARALTTMGVASLRLVRPADFRCAAARRLAHGSTALLDTALEFETLEQAIDDVDFAVATTARRRRLRSDYCDVADLPTLVERKGGGLHSLAVVFGPEERGLRTEEIMACDTVSLIPMARTYPSLNLAQAVMLYAYTLSPLQFRHAKRKTKAPGAGEFRALRRSAADLLLRIGFHKRNSVYNRILERLGLLSEVDVHLLHSVCSHLEGYLRRNAPEDNGAEKEIRKTR